MTGDAPDSTLLDLSRRITRVESLLPEHVIGNADDAPDEVGSDAVLIDQWGRAHPLLVTSTIGRDAARSTIAILQGSVSRQHVELRLEDDVWRVRDVGSTNGTFVEGKRVDAWVTLADRQLLSVGDVGLVLVGDRATVRARRASDSLMSTSARPGDTGARLRLLATPGGAGVLELGAERITLASTQFALLELLVARFREERDRPDAVRGFVRSVEILASLPWDTAHPEDNHLKQLVRRLRRALDKLGLEDAIEARHGLGYRFLVEPLAS